MTPSTLQRFLWHHLPRTTRTLLGNVYFTTERVIADLRRAHYQCELYPQPGSDLPLVLGLP